MTATQAWQHFQCAEISLSIYRSTYLSVILQQEKIISNIKIYTRASLVTAGHCLCSHVDYIALWEIYTDTG